jgi:hypothetical protein
MSEKQKETQNFWFATPKVGRSHTMGCPLY